MFNIDFHCHPDMKPYGKSFRNIAGKNSINPKDSNSVWHADLPTVADRAIHSLAGLVKFTQADLTTLLNGNVHIICASMYPIERNFFANNLGEAIVADALVNLATGVGQERIDDVQCCTDYFADLNRIYQYYLQFDGKDVETVKGKACYKLVKNFAEIEANQAQPNLWQNTVFIVLSIEGMHAINSNLTLDKPDEANLMANLSALKKWPHPPFFVTLAHHFNNHLCGQAKSLDGAVGSVADQSDGMQSPITPLGLKVIKELLNKQTGRRIYIDIKHMNPQCRRQYFTLLANDYKGENIPVLASHAAANGLQSMDNKTVKLLDTGSKMFPGDINFYDDEIISIAKSGGVFCLQLDKRRVANKEAQQFAETSAFADKAITRSALVWNQVRHVAELLDEQGLPAWNTVAIGSDFDGIINPINNFLTAESLNTLRQYLLNHAAEYMRTIGSAKLKKANRETLPADIIDKIFYRNGMEFFKKWF